MGRFSLEATGQKETKGYAVRRIMAGKTLNLIQREKRKHQGEKEGEKGVIEPDYSSMRGVMRKA